MTAKIVQLVHQSNTAFDFDKCLEEMKGRPFNRLMIIAAYEDGSEEVAGNCSIGEALYMMERVKHEYMTDEGD